MSNVVAIVGRPNVGKSTLFNRMIGARQAIVDDESGVTRDRQYGVAEWNGKSFTIIDTGGFVPNSEDIFESEVRKQVKIAMEEASVLLFMTDVTCGITDLDAAMANMLRKSKKDLILVVNKVDNHARQLDANEFYKFGFKNVCFISSINGSGTGELLDEVAKLIEEEKDDSEKNELPKLAIIGQPNVGKSSLLNALVGEERNIVTEIAGTTRDAIHTHYKLFQKEFLLIDTAGIRKKAKVHQDLEFYSVIRAIKAMEEADICLLLLDATLGIEGQDISIFSLAQKRKKGIVLLVNKWDLVEKTNKSTKEFEEKIKKKIAPFTDVPILFISAKDKTRIFKAIEIALDVYENRKKRVSTSEVNKFLEKATAEYSPPSINGHFVKIKYGTQLHTNTPSFAFFCNYPQYVKVPYKNYLENKLREQFDFKGVPISIYFRQK